MLLLLIIYLFVSFLLFYSVIRRDVYFGAFFGVFLIYSIIPQWGYYLYPDLSKYVIHMYFGEEPLFVSVIFSLMSLICLYVFFQLFYMPFIKSFLWRMRRARGGEYVYVAFCVVYIFGIGAGIYGYGSELSYSNATDVYFREGVGFGFKVFKYLYKSSVFMLLVLYALWRDKLIESKKIYFLNNYFAGFLLMMFLYIAVKTGSRTDFAALFIGVLAYEYYRSIGVKRLGVLSFGKGRLVINNLYFWLSFVAVVPIVLFFMAMLRDVRSEITLDDFAYVYAPRFAYLFFLNDYFSPYHVLIGAIHYDYVKPLNVVFSNFSNSLMFLNFDYLQSFIINEWAPYSVSRVSSPAMFAFAEGYAFLGMYGCVYNGMVFTLGIALWRFFSISTNRLFNAIAFSVTIAMVLTVARSQSSYFIKDVYLFFFPAFLLYCSVVGIWPSFSVKIRC